MHSLKAIEDVTSTMTSFSRSDRSAAQHPLLGAVPELVPHRGRERGQGLKSHGPRARNGGAVGQAEGAERSGAGP